MTFNKRLQNTRKVITGTNHALRNLVPHVAVNPATRVCCSRGDGEVKCYSLSGDSSTLSFSGWQNDLHRLFFLPTVCFQSVALQTISQLFLCCPSPPPHVSTPPPTSFRFFVHAFMTVSSLSCTPSPLHPLLPLCWRVSFSS